MSDPQELSRRLRDERDEARQIVRDIHWMAVRYADGRKSYAPGMFNDAVRKAYAGGWLDFNPRNQDLDPQYARDGMSPEWQSIEERLDAQAARIAELEKALRPFAEFADVDDTVEAQEWLLSPRSIVVLVARKALSK